MRNLLTASKAPRLLIPLIALLLAIVPAGIARSNDAGFGNHESPAVVSEQSFWSASLDADMPLAVYLPPGYDSNPKQRYPVLYMLHGLGGDHDQWRNEGLFDAATQLITSGALEPMIIVTPEGGRGYWMDHSNQGPLFGSYVAGDLVSMIDTRYRTISERGARAIGGMSMGGHGALQLAMNHPAEFGIVGAHSVALRRQDQAFDFFGQGPDYQSRDPVSLCAAQVATARSFTLWLDIGANDPWSNAAQAFHQQLVTEQVQHRWSLNPGGHNDAYWSAHVRDYLTFYSQAFAQNLGHGTQSPQVHAPAKRINATVTGA